MLTEHMCNTLTMPQISKERGDFEMPYVVEMITEESYWRTSIIFSDLQAAFAEAAIIKTKILAAFPEGHKTPIGFRVLEVDQEPNDSVTE